MKLVYFLTRVLEVLRYCVLGLLLIPSSVALASADLEERLVDANTAAEEAELDGDEVNESPLPDPTQSISVAVYPLVAQNIPEAMSSIVSEQVLAEIRKLTNLSAVGMEEIMEMLALEGQKQSVGCGEDDSCIAEIAGALGVDELVTGRISETPTGRFLMIRRIDQREARTLRVFQQPLEIGDGTEFLAAIEPAILKIFPGRDVRPGEERGVSDEVALRLNPPPLPPWATWTVLGTSAAALATGGVLSYLAFDQNQTYRDSGTQIGSNPGSYYASLESSGRSYEQSAQISLIAGGVAVLSGVVMSFFTDWMDYGAAAPE